MTSNTTSGCISKEMKTAYGKDVWTSLFTVTLFTIAKMWKQEPINGLMDKEDMVPTHSGILLSHEKEILPFATIRMYLEGIMLSEGKSDEKGTYCMVSLYEYSLCES